MDGQKVCRAKSGEGGMSKGERPRTIEMRRDQRNRVTVRVVGVTVTGNPFCDLKRYEGFGAGVESFITKISKDEFHR